MIFHPEHQELLSYLQESSEVGVSYIPKYLSDEEIAAMQNLCQSLEWRFKKGVYEQVTEEYFVPTDLSPTQMKRLLQLGNDFAYHLAQYSGQFPILADWVPTEYSLQQYDERSYVSSHRDQRFFQGVIVVLALQGEATFAVRNTRSGETFASWRTKPGDLILLRAKDLNLDLVGHPGVFHEVGGALTETPRISLGLRYTDNA